jgi:hypothetical protein
LKVVNCQKRAYPAATKKVAAGKGHILQVAKYDSKVYSTAKTISLVQVFFIAPLSFFEIFRNGQTRLKKLYVAQLNYTQLENCLFLGLNRIPAMAVYIRPLFGVLFLRGHISLKKRT